MADRRAEATDSRLRRDAAVVVDPAARHAEMSTLLRRRLHYATGPCSVFSKNVASVFGRG
jgi:hypothetical protein